ncbi:MAG: Pvc16 family protein [Chloroflexota bacterium]
MIEQVDERLQKWVKSVVGETAVSFAPPHLTDTPTVSIYLHELADAPPYRTTSRPPLQIELRYLVTTTADTPAAAHSLLGRLIFAAMRHSDYTVQLDPIPPAAWAAFGTPPLPSFHLCIPLQQARDDVLPPLVRQPLDVVASPIAQLNGIVIGPNKIPIAKARVEYPELARTVVTDNKGRFQLTAVPTEPTTKKLRIHAKGKSFDTTIELPQKPDQEVVVQIDLA